MTTNLDRLEKMLDTIHAPRPTLVEKSLDEISDIVSTLKDAPSWFSDLGFAADTSGDVDNLEDEVKRLSRNFDVCSDFVKSYIDVVEKYETMIEKSLDLLRSIENEFTELERENESLRDEISSLKDEIEELLAEK